MKSWSRVLKHSGVYSLKNRAEQEIYDTLKKCDFCDKEFYYGSEKHRLHLIWYHGKYMTPCETKEVHKLFLQTYWGFKLRPIARSMKLKYRRKIKYQYSCLFATECRGVYKNVKKIYNNKSRITRFFESIENLT